VEELGRAAHLVDGVQREVEASRVADDDGAVLVALRGRGIETEVGRVEADAPLGVADRKAKMVQPHRYSLASLRVGVAPERAGGESQAGFRRVARRRAGD
jgi:hypothetical protein